MLRKAVSVLLTLLLSIVCAPTRQLSMPHSTLARHFMRSGLLPQAVSASGYSPLARK